MDTGDTRRWFDQEDKDDYGLIFMDPELIGGTKPLAKTTPSASSAPLSGPVANRIQGPGSLVDQEDEILIEQLPTGVISQPPSAKTSEGERNTTNPSTPSATFSRPSEGRTIDPRAYVKKFAPEEINAIDRFIDEFSQKKAIEKNAADLKIAQQEARAKAIAEQQARINYYRDLNQNLARRPNSPKPLKGDNFKAPEKSLVQRTGAWIKSLFS